MDKKRKLIIIAGVCLILVLIPLYVNHPNRKYQRAVESFNSKAYEDALNLFETIPNYRDSGMYIGYLTAQGDYKAERYDEAEKGFSTLGDFLDSRELAKICADRLQVINYDKALKLFEQQNYKEAGTLFSALGKYEEAPRYATYCEAMNSFSEGEYRKARERFLSVSGFADADKWAEASIMMEQEEIYREAIEKYENGEYEAARELFQGIEGYEDSASFIYYMDGLIALDAQKYTVATTAFKSIAGFRDADELARLSMERQLSQQYQEAVRLFKQDKYDEATVAFNSISDYADSMSYIAYMDATRALADEQYPEAIETFRKLGSFLDSRRQADAAEAQYNTLLYNIAMTHYEDENYTEAVDVFRKLGTYSDAAQYTAYLSGILAEQAEKYDEAARYYAKFPDFKDSQERSVLSQAAFMEQQYKLGMEEVTAGNYASAKTRFDQVEGYKDTARYQTYISGQLALAEQDFLTAETAFGELGRFLDSRTLREFCTEQLKPVRYEAALEALDAGFYEKAIEGFAQLEGYQDADRYTAYARALQTAYVGDYPDAMEMLGEMKGFLDSDTLVIYFGARQAEVDSRYEQAAEIYETIPDFRDSQERLDRLPDLILDRDFEQLADRLMVRSWWNRSLMEEVEVLLSREYRMTNTTVALRFFHLAETLLDEGEFEHSYQLMEVVAQKDERILSRLDDIQYMYALSEMEKGRLSEAEWMLSELSEASYTGAQDVLVQCWTMLENEARENGNEIMADIYRAKIEGNGENPDIQEEAAEPKYPSMEDGDVQEESAEPTGSEMPVMDFARKTMDGLMERLRDAVEEAESCVEGMETEDPVPDDSEDKSQPVSESEQMTVESLTGGETESALPVYEESTMEGEPSGESID